MSQGETVQMRKFGAAKWQGYIEEQAITKSVELLQYKHSDCKSSNGSRFCSTSWISSGRNMLVISNNSDDYLICCHGV